MKPSGFTLIELLIVVAIIAILAAIAVPNFLEAQTRAKVSRSLADMRTIDTGIHTYVLDNDKVPPSAAPNFVWPYAVDGNGWIRSWRQRLIPVTTPIAYLSTVPSDAFGMNSIHAKKPPPGFKSGDFTVPQYCEDYFVSLPTRGYLSPPGRPGAGYVSYDAAQQDVGWRLISCGPDNVFNYDDSAIPAAPFWEKDGMPYDASNGTVSHGDVFRYGGADRGNRNKI